MEYNTVIHSDVIQETSERCMLIPMVKSLSDVDRVRYSVRDQFDTLADIYKSDIKEYTDLKKIMLQIILGMSILKQGGKMVITVRSPIYELEMWIFEQIRLSFLEIEWIDSTHLECTYYLGYNQIRLNKLASIYSRYNKKYSPHRYPVKKN